MIAKMIIYAAAFLIIRSWIKLIFKPKDKISASSSSSKNFNQKDVFEADFKVVKDD